ncbi:ATP-grasp domain-containing protein [Planctomycetota bacterium]
MSFTVAVTGLNATDNPAPGVPVVRAIREACPECRVVGLAYDALDPGNYMHGIADNVYLMPYPSQGTRVMLERLKAVCVQTPIDVVIPCLDAELPAYLRLEKALNDLGIHMFLPDEERLKLRSKVRFHELATKLGIQVPNGLALSDAELIGKLHRDFSFPVMVKGQFYDAYLAHTPLDVRVFYNRLSARWGLPVVIQEFIAGEEYDVVAVGDGEGGMVGSVAMRKMQLTDKGKAWGGVTIAYPELDSFCRDVMSKLKWRGPCELEILQATDDGSLYLIEVNPRFPAWVYLAVGAGRNLPWATVRLALGEEVTPMDPAPPGVMFLRHSVDQICAMTDYQSLTVLGELHRGEAQS